jgi:hypothetical protein
LDTELSFCHSAASGILGGIADLLGGNVTNEPEKKRKKEDNRKRGMSR